MNQKFAHRASLFCGRGRELVTSNIIRFVGLLETCLRTLFDSTIVALKLAERGPPNGRIVYHKMAEKDIFIMDDDGYHSRRLTDTQLSTMVSSELRAA